MKLSKQDGVYTTFLPTYNNNIIANKNVREKALMFYIQVPQFASRRTSRQFS